MSISEFSSIVPIRNDDNGINPVIGDLVKIDDRFGNGMSKHVLHYAQNRGVFPSSILSIEQIWEPSSNIIIFRLKLKDNKGLDISFTREYIANLKNNSYIHDPDYWVLSRNNSMMYDNEGDMIVYIWEIRNES